MKKLSFKTKDGKDKKKKVLATLAALCAILALAGTFAWTSYTDWVRNHMQSLGFSTGDVTIVEDFDPDDPINPGGTIKKKVDVINSTPVEAFVRVSLEEQLGKLKSGATNGIATNEAYDGKKDSPFPVIVDVREYYLEGTPWKDITDSVKFVNGAGQKPAGLKVFVNGNETALVHETTINGDAFPANFEFIDTKFPLPFRPAKDTKAADYDGLREAAIAKLAESPAGNMDVAQKVSGYVKHNKVTGEYSIDLAEVTAGKKLSYFNYGVSVDALKEADWAGENVWVTTAADPTTKPVFETEKVASKVDSELKINFTKDKIYHGSGKTFDFSSVDTKAWFYNEDDGYFYYLSPISSGTQTEASLMESITFPDNATYNVAAYDLHVGSEAIPAQKSMLTAGSAYGAVDAASQAEYKLKGKVTFTDGSGFQLDDQKHTNLLTYLESKATIKEDGQ